eukprot:1447298-Amphidinium_carterae.1
MAAPPVPQKRPELVLTERPGRDLQGPQTRDEPPQVPKDKWGASTAEAPAGSKSSSEAASGSQTGTSQHRE